MIDSKIIDSITNFFKNLKEVNAMTYHGVVVFASIMLTLVVSYLFYCIFSNDNLLSRFLAYLASSGAGKWMLGGLCITFYSTILLIVIKKVLLSTIIKQKQHERKNDEECYAQTGLIEKEAMKLTNLLREELNSDVVTVEMFHNQVKYIGGMHKRFYDECFPAVNREGGVTFSINEFQNVPTNLFPICNYMSESKNEFSWFTMEELSKVDAGYAHILITHKCTHIGMRYMRSKTGEGIGILTCTWKEGHVGKIPDLVTIKVKMAEIAARLETTLDMTDYEYK